MLNKVPLYLWIGLLILMILMLVVMHEFGGSSWDEGPYVAIYIVVFLSYPLYIAVNIVSRIILAQSRNRRILEIGRDAEAIIVQLSESDWGTVSINQQPHLNLTLEVYDGSRPPYIVSFDTLIPRTAIPQFQPGARLHIKIAPDDPNRIAIVGIIAGDMPSNMMNVQQLEQVLMQHQAEHEQITRIGLQATAKVLQYMPMGFTVNGNNPAVNLLVEVQPASDSAFTAQIECVVIDEASVAQFQPGQMIIVRYDPNDPTKVALQHSNMMKEQQLEQVLMQHQAEHEQITKTGLQATAKVLQYMPMGFTVNSNNPAVNLLVEVQPASGSAFTAQIECVVIDQAAVPKFQPGQMVIVRYDPNDPTKVALQHSGV